MARVSPTATSFRRFTSGPTLKVSVLPSLFLSVTVRLAWSTAATVAVAVIARTARAWPGTPVLFISNGGLGLGAVWASTPWTRRARAAGTARSFFIRNLRFVDRVFGEAGGKTVTLPA